MCIVCVLLMPYCFVFFNYACNKNWTGWLNQLACFNTMSKFYCEKAEDCNYTTGSEGFCFIIMRLCYTQRTCQHSWDSENRFCLVEVYGSWNSNKVASQLSVSPLGSLNWKIAVMIQTLPPVTGSILLPRLLSVRMSSRACSITETRNKYV